MTSTSVMDAMLFSRSNNSVHPIHHAASACRQQVLQLFLKVLDPAQCKSPLLPWVLREPWSASIDWPERLQSTRWLLQRRPDLLIDAEIGSILHCAIMEGWHEDIVATIVEAHPAALKIRNATGFTPVHLLIPGISSSLLRLCYSVDPSAFQELLPSGRSLLHELLSPDGCMNDTTENDAFTLLCFDALGLASVTDRDGRLPLHYAAGFHGEAVASQIFELFPAAIKHRDGDGRCPLHIAALYGSTSTIDYLYCMWKDGSHAKDARGCTPAAVAIRNRTDAVDILEYFHRRYGDRCDFFRHAPISLFVEAIQKDNTNVLRFLMGLEGSSRSPEDGRNRTWLHFAVEHNAVQCAELLMRHHAVMLTNAAQYPEYGLVTPRQLAERNVDIAMVKVILKWQPSHGGFCE